MKLKLKPIIITSVVTFSATVALAVGLSYIPFGDKKIEASGSKRFQDVVHSAPGLPVTTENNDSIKDVKSDYKTPLDLRASSPNIIKESEKVKYVALGDSISAGFDSQLDKDYPGNYDKEKNEVTGISFPTYLASFIKNSNADNSKLESYTNYASSGTTLEDWKFLLTVDESKLKELAEKDKNKLAYYKTKFGEDIIERAKQVKEELQKANLVTITLAANDFMELVAKKLKDPKFIEQIQNIKANPTNAIAGVSSAFQDTFKEMKKRIDDFSAELKKHVKTENVNFIGYPLPLPHLFVLLDGYLFKNNGSSLIVSQMAVESLNKNIQSQVTKNKFNFINPYDFSFWTDNSNINKLSPTLFDIHPGSFGYKKMAQDVFIKLIVPERNSDKLNENGIKWDNKYIFTDKDSFTTQLEFANQYKTVKKVLTDDINGNLFKEDEIFKKFSDKRKNKWEWYKKRVLNSSLVKNILNGAIDSLIQFPTIKEADPSSRLSNFFTKNNNENLNKLKKWLDESEFVPNFLLKSEIEFQETYWNKDKKSSSERAKLFDLINIFKNNLLNEANLISLIASFFSSDLIQKEKEELKEIIAEFAQNLIIKNVDEKMLSDAINKALGDNSSKAFKTENLAKLIKSVLSSNSIKKTIGELFINLANNSKIYGQAKSVAELLQKVLKDSHIQKTISDLASSLFDELSKEGALNKEFTNFVFEIVKSNNELFKDIDESSLKELLSKNIKGIGALDKEFKISETFINSLSVQLQEGKISDFNFANVLAQTLSKLSKNFEGENLDITLIKIFKIIANLDLKANKATLEKILTNSLNYFNKNSDLSKLIAQKIYQTSENKLSDIISNEKMISLFDKIFKSSEFSKAASSLISALADIDKNELEKVKTSSELVRLVLTKTSILKDNSEVINLVKKVLSLDETKELVSNLIAKYVPELKDVINSESANLFITKLLSNSDFQWILEDFLVRGIFGSSNDLSNFSFEKALKSWVADSNHNSAIVEKFGSLVKSLVKDKTSLEFISNIIYGQLSKLNGMTSDVSKDEFAKLFSNISDALIDEKDFETVSKDIFKKMLDGISKDGFKLNLSEFFTNIFKENGQKLDFSNPDNFLFKIFKTVSKSDGIQETKNTAQKLLINAFKFAKQSQELKDKISNLIFKNTHKTGNLVKLEDVQSFVSAIFNSNEFEVLFSDLVQSLISIDKIEWDKINSFNDLVQYVFVKFVNVKNTSLGQRVNELVKSLLSDESIKKLISKISLSMLKGYPEITKGINDSELESLFNSAIGKYNELDRVFKFENIYESLLGYLGSHIGNVDLDELSELLKSEFNRIFENKSIENTILDLVKAITKDNFVHNHKEVLAKLISNIFDFAESKKFISDSIAKEIIKVSGKSEIEKLISKDELSSLVNKLLKDHSFKGLLNSAIKNLADSDTVSIQNISTIKELIDLLANKIINSNDFNFVKQIGKTLVNSNEFTKLIRNASKEFFEFSDDDIKTLFNLIIDSQEMNDFAKDFLTKGIFSKDIKLNDLASLDLIIKSWLKDNNNSELASKLEKFFISVVKKEEVASIFAKASYNSAKKYGEVFENITLDEFTKFIKDLFGVLPEVSNKLKVREYFVEELFNELGNNGTKANLGQVFNNYVKKLSTSFSDKDWDKNLLELIKVVNSKALIKNNKEMLTKLIDNAVSKVFTNQNFGKDLGTKLFNSSVEIKNFVSEQDFNNLIQKTFKSTNFQNLFKQLSNELLSIDSNELEKANSIKMLLNRAVHSLKNNRTKTHLVQFAKEFINFEESNKLLKNLFDSIGSIKGKNSFSLDQIKELVNYLADDKDLQELTISLLTDGFFSDKMSLSDFNDYDKLIKTWLGNPDVKKSVLKNVKNIISKAFNKSSIRHTFATIIYKLMQSEKLLIENITDNDLIALISDSLQNYEKVNNLLDFNGWFLDGVFDELAKNGTKIDNKAIEKLATENLKDKFSYENWEKTAIGLIKSLATTEIVLNHEDTIGQFVANIFSYSAGSENAGSLIYDQILNSYGDKISQYIQKDKFNELIKTVFVKNQKAFASIMKNITLSMKQDINKYHNAQSIIDIFKIYFDQEEKIYLILKDLSVVVESLLKDETIKGLIKKLLSEQLKQYSVDVDSDENKKFFSALLNELPSLINDLHLLSNVLTGINSGLKEYKNITSLFSDIISLTLKSIKFKDFTLAKVILDSKTLEKHHKVLGANIAKIVEGASSNDELVSKFIDDFGLTKLLSSKGISDLDAKELFKSILKSGDTKGALSLFINEFFKDTSKFKNVNSWAKLISTLVGAVDETKVKEHIKKWMRQIVNKTDNKLFDVMANLLTEQFNKNGYSIPEWENTKISKFLSSITKSIVGGETEQKDQDILSILNDIIDGIFTALKGLKDEDDILSKIAEAAKNGALKFITDNNSISIAKVFDNIPKFQKLLDKVDAKAYADFINVMFKYAHPSDDKGLFKAIFHSDKSSSNNTSLGFKGFWGVIQGKVQQLISAFVTPLMKNYVQELIDTQKVYKTAQEVKEKIEGYQAVWRVYASLAAMLYSNTPSGLFWNATNWTSEGFLRAGFKDAFEKAIKGINLVKYKGNYAAIGLKKENEVNQEFWAGVSPLRHSSTSNGLRWWRYARDYVLAYVYYQDNKDDKYHKRTGKTMRQVLIEDLIKGYMPVQK